MSNKVYTIQEEDLLFLIKQNVELNILWEQLWSTDSGEATLAIVEGLDLDPKVTEVNDIEDELLNRAKEKIINFAKEIK